MCERNPRVTSHVTVTTVGSCEVCAAPIGRHTGHTGITHTARVTEGKALKELGRGLVLPERG